ncbi:MAG: hypothetical protein J6S67_13180 [Methanobrevibacter sp.]|nr:hypothetical protein [Methanobrevibacter sp.]
MTQYVGARYVLKIYENSLDPSTSEWESGVNYEPLTLVQYNYGSYISKKDVPANIGNPANNPEYWTQTGFYSGQIAELQAIVGKIKIFSKVSDMVSNSDLVVGDIVHTMGYYNPEDGGESYFVVTNTDSDGYCIHISGSLYAKLIVINDSVRPEQFGAQENDNIQPIWSEMEDVADNILIFKNFKLESDTNVTKNIIGSNNGAILTLDDCSIILTDYTGAIRDVDITCTAADYAIKAHHFHKTATLNNVLIVCNSGISIERSWYFEFSNVRIIMPDDVPTGIGIKFNSVSQGGVNAAVFNNVSVGGGLHSILFDRSDPATPALCEGLTFNSCALEGASGATIYVTYPSDVAAMSFNECYFEYANTASADTISIIYRMGSGGTDIIEVNNCLVRNTPVSIPLFGTGIHVNNIKSISGSPLFVTNAYGSKASGYGNISRQLPNRWSDAYGNDVNIPLFSSNKVLSHRYNSDYKEYTIGSGDNDIVIKINDYNYFSMGYIELFIAFAPNGYNYNHCRVRLKYGFGTGPQRCDVTLVDKYETYADAFNNLTMNADITSSPDRRITLTLSTTSASFIGSAHVAIIDGFDNSNQFTGEAITLE